MTGSHVSFAAHCRHYPRSNSKTETLFPSVETSAENMFKLTPTLLIADQDVVTSGSLHTT